MFGVFVCLGVVGVVWLWVMLVVVVFVVVLGVWVVVGVDEADAWFPGVDWPPIRGGCFPDLVEVVGHALDADFRVPRCCDLGYHVVGWFFVGVGDGLIRVRRPKLGGFDDPTFDAEIHNVECGGPFHLGG